MENDLVVILSKDAPSIFARILNTFDDQVIVKFKDGQIKQYSKWEVMGAY